MGREYCATQVPFFMETILIFHITVSIGVLY